MNYKVRCLFHLNALDSNASVIWCRVLPELSHVTDMGPFRIADVTASHSSTSTKSTEYPSRYWRITSLENKAGFRSIQIQEAGYCRCPTTIRPRTMCMVSWSDSCMKRCCLSTGERGMSGAFPLVACDSRQHEQMTDCLRMQTIHRPQDPNKAKTSLLSRHTQSTLAAM